ncbi:MAG: B12-binding domain-containing radical SAM protein [Promethearchaeota archaeon]
MRILVIDCLTLGKGTRKLTRDFIGAGPRMVCAAIEKSGLEANLTRGETFLENPETYLKNNDMCFISGMSIDKTSIYQVAKRWKTKKNNPRALVMIGGPVALEYKQLLNNPYIDGVFIGESERAIQQFVKNLERITNESPGKDIFISGVVFKKDLVQGSKLDVIKVHLDNPPIKFLETIDPVIEKVLNYENYWAARVYIECLRGCSNFLRARLPYIRGHKNCIQCGFCENNELMDVSFKCPSNIPPGCGFCSTPVMFGPVRSFDREYIRKQVEKCVNLGIHRIVLGGSDFLEYKREMMFNKGFTSPNMPPAPNHEELSALINSLLEISDIQDGNVQLIIENIKASLCDDKALKIISRIPRVSLSIGVETGNDRHLSLIGKSSSVSSIKNAVRLLKKNGIRFSTYFIHSLPGQNKKTVQDSLSLMRWLDIYGVEKITLYRFKPLPGSAFSKEHVPEKRIKESRPLIRLAREINSKRKQLYLNKIFEVLIAEPDLRSEGDAIGYLLAGGPKVKIVGRSNLINDKKVHVVKIKGVLSDKMLVGELVDDGVGI